MKLSSSSVLLFLLWSSSWLLANVVASNNNDNHNADKDEFEPEPLLRRTSERKRPKKCSKPLNILLTNDDGFDVANLQEIFAALKEEGHNVALVAPYQSQSGASASVKNLGAIYTSFTLPIPGVEFLGPTQSDSVCGSVKAGSEPLTAVPGDGSNIYYIDGPPTMAVFYGIDVVSQEVFGGPPDLVVSGPNTGGNYGHITTHSGTVGAAVTALNRGIPSVAFSADNGEDGDDDCDPKTYNPALIAALASKVIQQLECKVDRQGDYSVDFPAFTGLNVNIPPTAGLTVDDADEFHYRMTEIGVSAGFGYRFYADLCDCPVPDVQALCSQVPNLPPLPGLCVNIPYNLDGVYPDEKNRKSEYQVAFPSGPMGDPTKTVTISVIESSYQAGKKDSRRVAKMFKGL